MREKTSQDIYRIRSLHIAFPDHENPPPSSLEVQLVSLIAQSILLELGLPKLDIRLWKSGLWAATMLMPEATVDEDHRPPFNECKVRFAGQIAPAQTEPKSQTVGSPSHGKFRLRIPAANRSHITGSSFCERRRVHVFSENVANRYSA